MYSLTECRNCIQSVFMRREAMKLTDGSAGRKVCFLDKGLLATERGREVAMIALVVRLDLPDCRLRPGYHLKRCR